MKFQKEYIGQLNYYFITLMIGWLLAAYLLITKGYDNSFLLLNSHHHPFWDKIMPYLTQFGDSLILSSIILILFIRKNMALTFTAIIAIIVSGLVLLSLKQFVFPEWHRPLKAIGEDRGIHFIKGFVEYNASFPSGHSTTIASAFPFIAYLFRNKLVQVKIALASMLFCYTRIYLGCHFLGDVLAGNVLGTVFAVIGIGFLFPVMDRYFDKKSENIKRKIVTYSTIIGVVALGIGLSSRFLL